LIRDCREVTLGLDLLVAGAQIAAKLVRQDLLNCVAILLGWLFVGAQRRQQRSVPLAEDPGDKARISGGRLSSTLLTGFSIHR
jgi:hypothetical protein